MVGLVQIVLLKVVAQVQVVQCLVRQKRQQKSVAKAHPLWTPLVPPPLPKRRSELRPPQQLQRRRRWKRSVRSVPKKKQSKNRVVLRMRVVHMVHVMLPLVYVHAMIISMATSVTSNTAPDTTRPQAPKIVMGMVCACMESAFVRLDLVWRIRKDLRW